MIHTEFNTASMILKGTFSSGIEGALASPLNHNFNWKQLSEMILFIFLLMFSKRNFQFWAWASHFIMI